jgi:hypothetical protein
MGRLNESGYAAEELEMVRFVIEHTGRLEETLVEIWVQAEESSDRGVG